MTYNRTLQVYFLIFLAL